MVQRQQFEDPLEDIDPIMEQAYSVSTDDVDLSNKEEDNTVEVDDLEELPSQITEFVDSQQEEQDQTVTAFSDDDNQEKHSKDTDASDTELDYDISDIEFPPLSEEKGESVEPNVFNNIPVGVSVELGRSQVSLKEVFELTEGTVIELDRLVGEPLDLVVNGQVIAQGEVVAIDNNYGLRVTSIVAKLD